MIDRLALAWTIARRELRAGFRPLLVVVGCLAVGVATIAAVGVSAESVRETVRRDARALLGGDVELESANRPVDAAELAALFPPGAALSTTVRTTTLVSGPTGRRLAVSLKAVDPAWPLVGSVDLAPAQPIAAALEGRSAVVEESVLTRTGARLGDRLALGDTSVVVTAVLRREPDRIVGFASFGPRVIVSRATLEASGVLRPGALLRYEHRAVVPQEELPELLARLRAAEVDAGWRLRSAAEVEPRIARFSDRLASYLTLAGLAALLVGGLGVALAVAGYLAGRRQTIAVLKALGASGAEVDLAYAMVLAVAAVAGVAVGLSLGQLLPFVLAGLVAGELPVRVEAGLHLRPLALAAAAGLLTAALFAGWPLAQARAVSAASLLRAEIAPIPRLPPLRRLPVLGLVAAALAGLAVASVDRPILGVLFVAGALATILVLGLLGRVLLGLAARALRDGPVPVRLAARNLARSTSAALPVLVGLGAGLGALVTIGLLEANLVRELSFRVSQRAPSHLVIDIQPGQWARFERLVSESPGVAILQSAPTLRARIVRIKGEPVERATIAEHVRWTVDRDRGLTWQAEPPAGTELVAGAWWPADHAGPPLVSVEAEVAAGYGVGVGDTLTFNVLGRLIEARIANIRREIDWASGRLDFVFVLSPGLLDQAPHVRIVALDVAREHAEAFLDRLAEAIPNATPIEIGSLVREVSATLQRIAAAIRIVAAITLVTGLLVLAAALLAARRRHLQQTVLLKILGAERRQILRVLVSEHLLLALLAGIGGVSVGTLAAWAIVRLVLDLPWSLPPAVPLSTVVLATGLTLMVSAVGVWRLLGRSAAGALRAT